jgi:hypothetical protein
MRYSVQAKSGRWYGSFANANEALKLAEQVGAYVIDLAKGAQLFGHSK